MGILLVDCSTICTCNNSVVLFSVGQGIVLAFVVQVMSINICLNLSHGFLENLYQSILPQVLDIDLENLLIFTNCENSFHYSRIHILSHLSSNPWHWTSLPYHETLLIQFSSWPHSRRMMLLPSGSLYLARVQKPTHSWLPRAGAGVTAILQPHSLVYALVLLCQGFACSGVRVPRS